MRMIFTITLFRFGKNWVIFSGSGHRFEKSKEQKEIGEFARAANEVVPGLVYIAMDAIRLLGYGDDDEGKQQWAGVFETAQCSAGLYRPPKWNPPKRPKRLEIS
eukprot:scaffold118126_cov56-Attheya_sp.AAC.5